MDVPGHNNNYQCHYHSSNRLWIYYGSAFHCISVIVLVLIVSFSVQDVFGDGTLTWFRLLFGHKSTIIFGTQAGNYLEAGQNGRHSIRNTTPPWSLTNKLTLATALVAGWVLSHYMSVILQYGKQLGVGRDTGAASWDKVQNSRVNNLIIYLRVCFFLTSVPS